jgi:membrane protein DedA with SNARE-associated domain
MMVLREMAIYNTSYSGSQVAAGFMSIFSLSQSYYYYYHLQSALPTSSSSSWVSNIISILTAWIADYGYPAVFAAALLETIFPPIPSEIVFPLAGFTAYNRQLGLENAIGMAAVGALGSTLGAIAIYYASLKAGKAAIIRYGKYVRVGTKEIEKAEKWFEKHGELAVFLGRMAPGVREIISIPAGISKMNITKFVLFTFAGSLIWSVMLSLAGYYGGAAWSQLSESLSSILGIVSAIIVAGIIAFIVIEWLKGHHSSKRQK